MEIVCCPEDVHERIKSDALRWAAGTRYGGIQMSGGIAAFVVGHCRICGSTLYRRPDRRPVPAEERP